MGRKRSSAPRRGRKGATDGTTFPLGFGPSSSPQSNDALEASGIELLRGLDGLQQFINFINSKAPAAIQDILSQINQAAQRSFDLFRQAVAADLDQWAQWSGRMRDRARGRVDARRGQFESDLDRMLRRAQQAWQRRAADLGRQMDPDRPPDQRGPGAGALPTILDPRQIDSPVSFGGEGVVVPQVPFGAPTQYTPPQGLQLPPGQPTAPGGTFAPGQPTIAPDGQPGADTSPFPPFSPAPVAPFPPIAGPPGTYAPGIIPGLPGADMTPGGIILPPPGYRPPLFPPVGAPPTCPPPTVVQCPVPAPPADVPDPPKGPTGAGTYFSPEQLCEFLELTWKKLQGDFPKFVDLFPNFCKGDWLAPAMNAGFPVNVVGWLGWLAVQTFCAIGQHATDLPVKLLKEASSTPFADLPAWMTRLLYGFAEKYGPSDIGDLKLPAVYASREHSQTGIMTPEQALTAWLSNTITWKEYTCMLRYNNLAPAHWHKYGYSRRSRVGANEVVALTLRKIIAPGAAEDLLRDLGWIDTSEIRHLFELAKFVPPPQDVIRMMVRDVADKNVVDRFGLHKLFGDKFDGRLRRYAEASGMSEETMLDYWAMHWQIPSPTQLYEMWHRLRHLGPGHPARVSFEDIKEALIQQDIPPFWIEKFLAISFTPLTRVDVRRTYDLGVIKRDKVLQAFRDRGLSDENAEVMTRYVEEQKARKFRSHKAAKLYAQGAISRFTAGKLMEADGAEEDQITEAVNLALTLEAGRSRQYCLNQLRKRYIVGEFDDGKARAEILGQGLDAEQMELVFRRWHCEKLARGRQPSASVLCDRLGRGVIGAVEYVQSLLRLGYDELEAQRMLNDCGFSIDERQRKIAAAKLAKDEAAKRALKRLEDQERKKLEQQADKRRKEASAMYRARAKRDLQMLGAATELSKRTTHDLEDSLPLVRKAYAILTKEFGLDPDSALRILSAATEALARPYFGDYLTDLSEVGREYVSSRQQRQAQGSNGKP